ncbi:hypothetical protein AABB24_010631 [Solanum stoloniferum]|uniref:Protein kinase domain-containing protein n=1 Tax=Solanum stoloniferum TaxID=62892 RepID=A0ABD2U9V5_9SOLN
MRKPRHTSSSKKGVEPKFWKNQKFAMKLKRKGKITPKLPSLILQIRRANAGDLQSADPLSLVMYCYLKFSGIPFRTEYTSAVPYLEILGKYYPMDQHRPIDQLKALTSHDIDHLPRQHKKFESFEKEMMHLLEKLELTTLYYLYNSFPSFDWASVRFENLKEGLSLTEITVEKIEEMMREACKTLSEKLHDGVYLFRDMVTKGELDVNESITLLLEKKNEYEWYFNPVTSVDAIFASISLVIVKGLVDEPIYKEFVKYTNLFAYVERFNVKFEKTMDAVDFTLQGGGSVKQFDYLDKLINKSICIRPGNFGDVHCCKFLRKNPLGLLVGTYAVKSFKQGYRESYKAEAHYLKQLRYKFIPKLIGYGDDGDARCYLIMQYYSGGSLRDILNDLTYDCALNTLIDVFDGLHLIHTHFEHGRIVHANLNPENIVLDEEWRAALCDFSLTHEVSKDEAIFHSYYVEREAEGRTEATHDKQAAEIYALGIIMIEVLTKEPIGARELEKTVRRKMQHKESIRAMIRKRIWETGCNDGRANELLDLTLCCISSERIDRPRAYEVSHNLRRIRDSSVYMRMAKAGDLQSADPLSLFMYCYLKYSKTSFHTKYTSGVPCLEILRKFCLVDQHRLVEQLKDLVARDIDQTARQHSKFESFKKDVMHLLEELELSMLYYLYKRCPSFDWASERFENLKEGLNLIDITEEKIEEMMRGACKNLSEELHDSVNLFRVTVKEGELDVKDSFSIVMNKKKEKRLDFNPVTSLDAIFTSISLIIVKGLVDAPIYQEFLKYTNLVAYVERFNVKYEKTMDAVNFSSAEGGSVKSFDYLDTLLSRSVRCGKGGFGDICYCEFLPKNPLGLPAGKYAVKSFRPRSILSYLGELYYLKELQYKFIPKLIGYGHDGGVRCHLIMKYYSGGSLRQKIGGLNYQHALTILIDVFDGLHLIHAHCENHRIVHADLKPENIVLDEEWRAALCDFGLTGEVFRKKAVWMSTYSERPKRRVVRPGYIEKTSYESQESEIYALELIMIEVLTKEPIDAVELAESVTGKMQSKESLLAMIRDEIKLSGCNYGRAKDLLLLALCCIRSKRKDRPRAYEVSYELRKIRDALV